MRLIITLCLASVLQAAPVKDAVSDKYTPAAFGDQHLGGILADRMTVNMEGRLLHVDESGILDCFRHRPGKQDWAGEHAGKFLDAAANTWLYTHDARLKTLMDRVARELIATQLPDGYLGTYLDEKRWTSWDVWVHKYDILGLLSYYRATGNEPALNASKKIGDLLVKTFGTGPGQRDIIASGTHVGMAATSVLEPMALLYRQTGDRRYLDFCNYLIQSWEQPNGPKIISSLLATGSVFKTANAKAYEMLSNIVGLTEMYRITGKPEYLKVAQIAWSDILAHRLYVDGTTSAAEHFHDDYELPGEDISNVGEGCVTVTFLQLTLQLLRLTGEAKYAEQLENTSYNALLAAQDPRKGDICYFTPLDGKKGPTPGINCCVSSEPRGISMLPSFAWGRKGEGVAIQFYTAGKASVPTAAGPVTIESTTSYPLEGSVRLTVTPAQPAAFPLYLRVPAWTASYKAIVAGKTYQGVPGEWLTIDRTWTGGDSVQIEMDMTARLVPGGPSNPYSVAVTRGPQLLALESGVNPGLIDLQAAGPRGAEVRLTDAHAQLPLSWVGKQAYSMEGVAAGKPKQLILVPFADAVTYRVWLLRP
jgi:DUF1680 family protein